MEFKVKKLANFTLKATGVFSKKFWLKKGKTEAEAEKRLEQRACTFTITNNMLTAQADSSGDGYLPFNLGNYGMDSDTLRNIGQLANDLATAIEEDEKELEKVA